MGSVDPSSAAGVCSGLCPTRGLLRHSQRVPQSPSRRNGFPEGERLRPAPMASVATVCWKREVLSDH